MSCDSTTCTSTNRPPTALPSLPDLRRSREVLVAWLDRVALGLELRHQRKQLLELDDRLLADIGVSRQQAVEEALKSSWMHIM